MNNAFDQVPEASLYKILSYYNYVIESAQENYISFSGPNRILYFIDQNTGADRFLLLNNLSVLSIRDLLVLNAPTSFSFNHLREEATKINELEDHLIFDLPSIKPSSKQDVFNAHFDIYKADYDSPVTTLFNELKTTLRYFTTNQGTAVILNGHDRDFNVATISEDDLDLMNDCFDQPIFLHKDFQESLKVYFTFSSFKDQVNDGNHYHHDMLLVPGQHLVTYKLVQELSAAYNKIELVLSSDGLGALFQFISHQYIKQGTIASIAFQGISISPTHPFNYINCAVTYTEAYNDSLDIIDLRRQLISRIQYNGLKDKYPFLEASNINAHLDKIAEKDYLAYIEPLINQDVSLAAGLIISEYSFPLKTELVVNFLETVLPGFGNDGLLKIV